MHNSVDRTNELPRSRAAWDYANFLSLRATGISKTIDKARTPEQSSEEFFRLKRAIGDRKDGYVFINPSTVTRFVSIEASFKMAVKELGLTALNGSKLRFHDLRHVFSNWLHRDGEGAILDQLRSLLGHKDRATTDRYVTVNHRGVGKMLSLLPNIREEKQKNGSTPTSAEAV